MSRKPGNPPWGAAAAGLGRTRARSARRGRPAPEPMLLEDRANLPFVPRQRLRGRGWTEADP